MFKLLAIRPLEGCADYIQKCLKTGMMYYFCNDYIIEPGSHIRRRSKNIKPLKEDFFTVVSESDYSEDNRSERKSPTVSVSAIVGMNGDGKSTLVELMMRLINNCAISYELCASSDSLRRVKDVKAELYYMVDNVIYRMVEEKKQDKTQIWKMTELDDNNGEMMRWEMKPKKIEHVDKDSGCFFFTIVSNYSHYAYNINDFKEEWEVKEGDKDDDEKCWLHYVFHKNDGYLTPITLHPYRYKGNIDINVEKDLSKQRLLSLFLNADNPNKDGKSFRNVNGKYANILKLTEETESKLQKRTIVEYFNAENQTNRFKELLDELDKANNDKFITSMLLDSDGVYNMSYDHLVDYLGFAFIKPINQIIEQDDDFCSFANEIADWMKAINKNKKNQYNGDIITVLRQYENQFNGKETFKKISECGQKAMKNIEKGNYVLAIEHFIEAMEISESYLGKDHIFKALILNDIAVAYEYLSDFDNAWKYYDEAIRIIKEEKLDDGPLSTTKAITYGNLAGLYKDYGEYKNAMDCCKTALEKVNLSSNPLLQIKIFNNKALVCEEMGEFGEALKYNTDAKSVIKDNHMEETSLAISNNINTARVLMAKGVRQEANKKYNDALRTGWQLINQASPNKSEVAIIYDSIAWAYLGMDNPRMALENFTTALKLREKHFGLEHIVIAKSYDNIAWVNVGMKNYKEAKDSFRVALKIRKNSLNDSNIQIAFSYYNLAWALYKNGEYSESKKEYENALDIMQNNPNTNPLYIAAIFYNLAGVCVFNGPRNYRKALDYYKKALAKCTDVLGEVHPDIATIYNNMALLYMKMGEKNYNNANELFNTALNIRSKVLGKNHLDTATVYNNIAIYYKKKGYHNKALENYNNALQIKEKKQGKRNRDTVFYYIKIAWEYYDMGNYREALVNFNEFLKIAETSFRAEDSDTIQYYYNIIAAVYKKNGEYGKAWEYHNKALKKEKTSMDDNYPDETTIKDTIKDVRYGDDKIIQGFEDAEVEKQLIPKNKRSEARLGKGTMEKIWESNDAAKRIINTKNQELIDTNRYKFLRTINATELGRLDTLYRIIKAYNIYYKKHRQKEIKTEIVTKSYSQLTLREKCQHYILYKVLSILSTYPQYQKAKTKDGVASIREFGSALEECVKDILNDNQSHITRKIRQVENFMDEGLQKGGLYERLGTKEEKSGALLVELDKLKEYYKNKNFSLDHLPPPIYKWDVIFNKKDDSNCKIELDSFSSGEKQQLYSIGAIIYHLQNLANTSSGVKYDNVNLVMEEIELYYHPEYQRLFLIRLLDSIRRANLGNMKNINIVFVTHSPFILSDIPKCNVLFLKDGMPKDIMQENTFGANIHTLLKNGFFMPNLPIGEFAYGKINALFEKLNTGDFDNDDEEKRKKELNDTYQQMLLVGEPFLRNQLLMLYNAFKGSSVVPMRTNEKGTES